MADATTQRKPPLCPTCRALIQPGEPRMRARDLQSYHLACYEKRRPPEQR